MHHDPIKIIQISDTHLFIDRNKELLGIKTQDSFQAVLNELQKHMNDIDCIIHSGDISQDGSVSSYECFANLIQDINVPVYYTPGNHDHLSVMEEVYPYRNVFNEKQIVLRAWQIILLNSQLPGKVPGHFDTTQFHHLENCLKLHPELSAIIIFHHHPYPVGSEWIDKLGVQNADEFWKIISHYPNVKAVFFGHIHQVNQQTVHGIACYSVPSTCIQFKTNQNQFGLEKLPPGYRWINLYDDGHIETGVERIADYIGEFDENAKGY